MHINTSEVQSMFSPSLFSSIVFYINYRYLGKDDRKDGLGGGSVDTGNTVQMYTQVNYS